MKKTNFNNQYDMVLELLKENEEYRKSDLMLLQRVYSDILGKDAGKMQFKTILNMIGKELPAFDTVCRARRKVQENHPELVDHDTYNRRMKKKQSCVAFARR